MLKNNRRDRREDRVFSENKEIGNPRSLVARGSTSRESFIHLDTAALCCGPKSCHVGAAHAWISPGSL